MGKITIILVSALIVTSCSANNEPRKPGKTIYDGYGTYYKSSSLEKRERDYNDQAASTQHAYSLPVRDIPQMSASVQHHRPYIVYKAEEIPGSYPQPSTDWYY